MTDPEGSSESPAKAARRGGAASRVAAQSEQTLLEQMGGIAGMAYSAVPIVVFVLVNALVGLMIAIWSAIGTAVLIALVRLLRKEPLQPAISGVLGVAICSFIAYRSGDAKGFFLFGIWTSLLYGGAFLASIVVRWPLVGVAWSVLNMSLPVRLRGESESGPRSESSEDGRIADQDARDNAGAPSFAWRRHRKARFAYDVATFGWTLVFLAKYVVQQWLYNNDQTGWLAVARIGMGYPLTGLALILTFWAIRRVTKLMHEQEALAAGSAPA